MLVLASLHKIFRQQKPKYRLVICLFHSSKILARIELLNHNALWQPFLNRFYNSSQNNYSTTSTLLEHSNYYKILNVKQTALTKEIKAAYYQIAKQCHPDMNDNDPKAAERFRKVSEAYEVLCDEI